MVIFFNITLSIEAVLVSVCVFKYGDQTHPKLDQKKVFEPGTAQGEVEGRSSFINKFRRYDGRTGQTDYRTVVRSAGHA